MQHKYVVGSVIICRVLKGVALLVFLCLHCIVRICAVRILLVWKGVLFLSDCLPIFIPTCVGSVSVEIITQWLMSKSSVKMFWYFAAVTKNSSHLFTKIY